MGQHARLHPSLPPPDRPSRSRAPASLPQRLLFELRAALRRRKKEERRRERWIGCSRRCIVCVLCLLLPPVDHSSIDSSLAA